MTSEPPKTPQQTPPSLQSPPRITDTLRAFPTATPSPTPAGPRRAQIPPSEPTQALSSTTARSIDFFSQDNREALAGSFGGVNDPFKPASADSGILLPPLELIPVSKAPLSPSAVKPRNRMLDSMTNGMRNSIREGLLYGFWNHVLSNVIFHRTNTQAAYNYTHPQYPFTLVFSNLNDLERTPVIDQKKRFGGIPPEKLPRDPKDKKPKPPGVLQTTSTKVPDFVQVLELWPEGKETYPPKRMVIFLLEVKAWCHPSGIDEQLTLALSQTRQQAKWAFAENIHVKILGAITSVGKTWTYVEYRREDVYPRELYIKADFEDKPFVPGDSADSGAKVIRHRTVYQDVVHRVPSFLRAIFEHKTFLELDNPRSNEAFTAIRERMKDYHKDVMRKADSLWVDVGVQAGAGDGC
ncbi:hypothetical protein BC834DRAFT_1043227 [Gloeopeniophorella convolvens]|nr:hypothetical protein BC834DRAFT_1043227 [Gloeopeniophorella convolvens]